MASIAVTAVLAVVLAGCALPARSANTAVQRETDCSFESAATCWMIAGRFPSRRGPAPDTSRVNPRAQPPASLVVRTDSAVISP